MFVNYLLTISLVLLVIIFVVTLMSISRFVLSDFNPIGEHVMQTQNLLNEVGDVQEAVNSSKIVLNNDAYLSLSYKGFQATEIAYINVNSTRSIVTMFFNTEVGSINEEIYYFRINDSSNLNTGEILVFENDGVRLGEFVSLNDEGEVLIIDSYDQKVLEVPINSVFGRVFYTGNKND